MDNNYMDNNNYNEALAGSCLTWGIVAMVFAETGLLGLIFAIIAKSKVRKYVATGATLAGKAKVGHILATIALILSILAIVFFIFYFGIFAVSMSNYIDRARSAAMH